MQSNEKTAFVTPDRLWQSKKMPIGLKWNTCLFYLNNIVIFARSLKSTWRNWIWFFQPFKGPIMAESEHMSLLNYHLEGAGTGRG